MSEAGRQPRADQPRLQESVASLSMSLSDRIEQLAAELRSRWKLGQRIPAEALAAGSTADAFAQVVRDEEQLLDLLYHEILIRQEHGELPVSAEFVERFPGLKDRIERLFAVHLAIEDDDWPDAAHHTTDDGAREFASGIELASGTSDHPGRNSLLATPQWPRKSRSRFVADPPPGYELIEEVGRGGMAVVYRARQEILNRTVALKMLLGGSMASSEVLARIRQEARAVAQLQHPGIVQIYEVGEHRGLPYLSLEFVPGGTLHEWLRGQPLPPMEASRIVEQLAVITQFAHERGIVHRDLKPANVLLTERPSSTTSLRTESIESSRPSIASTLSLSVKIGDFGLARVLGHQSELTATGQIIGTPSYMAPEQAAGTGDEASPAQDIYSLGAILFELLTGRPPFRGATLFDTLEQVRTDDPIPPRRLQPRVPEDLETICLKCLQKQPARRYQSAQQLADDLRAMQRGEPILARPSRQTERLWKLIRRHPTVSALVLLTSLTMIAGVSGVLIENRRANQREADASLQRDHALRLSDALTRERDEARAQRTAADLQRTLAEAARSEAVIARQQAEQSLDQSLTAINSLANFGIELRSTPQQQQTSRRILDETLKLYDQLEQEHSGNTRLRRQLAFTLVRAGEIRSVLRETTRARELLERAVTLLKEELRSTPDDGELYRFLNYANWVLGNLLKDTGRPDEAHAAYLQSLDAVNHELRLLPGDPARLLGKANVLTNICAVLSARGRYRDALPTFEEAIAILRELVASYPNSFGSQSELALVLHDYSGVLQVLKESEASQKTFDEALAIRESLFQKNPADYGNRNLYARLFMSRGSRLRAANEPKLALKEFQQAEDMLRPAVDAFPTIFEYQSATMNAEAAQVNACFAAGDADALEQAWAALTARLVQCRTTFRDERTVVTLMQTWLSDRCEFLCEHGRQEECRQLWQVLVASSEWLASDAAAAIDPLPTPEQRSVWINNLAWYLAIAPEPSLRDPTRAVTEARRALALDPANANHLHTLATALYEAGDYAGAIAAINDATAKLPANLTADQRDPLFATIAAMSHFQLGDHARARELLATVSEPSPELSKDGPQLRRLIGAARELILPESSAK